MLAAVRWSCWVWAWSQGKEGLSYIACVRTRYAIVMLLLAGCAAQRLKKEQAAWLSNFGTIAPPGTIALNDTLFYDRTEVINFYWLEYEFWVRRTFWLDTLEWETLLPDTAVWYGSVKHDSSYVENYLRHPAYRDYPLVGVTYEQALAYSKWRSDRVMEVFLVRAGIIPYRPYQTPEDEFTIERFYTTDSLNAYHYLPYPSYGLPTYAEWLAASVLADSLAKINIKHCGRMKTRQYDDDKTIGTCSETIQDGQFFINSKEHSGTRSWGIDYLAPIDCYRCGHDLIWQMRGNVTELCKDRTLVLGGGWLDPLDSILLDLPFPSRAPNAMTGFRNVCRWRKWNGVRQ